MDAVNAAHLVPPTCTASLRVTSLAATWCTNTLRDISSARTCPILALRRSALVLHRRGERRKRTAQHLRVCGLRMLYKKPCIFIFLYELHRDATVETPPPQEIPRAAARRHHDCSDNLVQSRVFSACLDVKAGFSFNPGSIIHSNPCAQQRSSWAYYFQS